MLLKLVDISASYLGAAKKIATEGTLRANATAANADFAPRYLQARNTGPAACGGLAAPFERRGSLDLLMKRFRIDVQASPHQANVSEERGVWQVTGGRASLPAHCTSA